MNDLMLYEKVRAVLLHEWDPIGICDFPEAQDEYDSYVYPLCEMINQGKDAHEIYDYLRLVVKDYMCLDGDEGNDQLVAEKLKQLAKTND